MRHLVKRHSAVLSLLFLLLSCFALTARAQYSGPAVVTTQPPTATVVTTDPSILYPPAREFRLVPGDLLKISIFGQQDFTPSVRLDLAGDVDLPFIGRVHLAGMTIPEAQRDIARRLIEGGVYTDPEVMMSVTEGPNAAVTVVGENHAVVPLVGQKGLLEVLTAAGGLAAGTSHIVTINRPDVPTPIVVDLGTDPARSTAANIPIFPGDIIVTGRVGVAFAVGAFKNPGPVNLNGNTALTLMEASAYVGGPAFEAKYSDMRLIRTVNGQRTVVKLDMRAILYGRAPDPILQPNDILFLPQSPLKAAMTNGSSSLLFSLMGVALSVATFVKY